MVVQGNCEKE